MLNKNMTAISEAVSQQALRLKPCIVSSIMQAQIESQMGESFSAMADDMNINGEEVPQAEPLTYEGLLGMIDSLELGRKPRNPYPPEHPLHAAWSFADNVESGDFVRIPWSYPHD